MPCLGKGRASVMRDPFLIDECLSPDLVALAHARGFDATHVVFRGLAGSPDRALLPIIRHQDFVFVTNNARDFLKLYARENIHAGLVIIVPGGQGACVLPQSMRRGSPENSIRQLGPPWNCASNSSSGMPRARSSGANASASSSGL